MGMCAQARVHRHVCTATCAQPCVHSHVKIKGQQCGVSAVATIHILGMYVGVCCRVALPCPHTILNFCVQGWFLRDQQPKAHRTLCT